MIYLNVTIYIFFPKWILKTFTSMLFLPLHLVLSDSEIFLMAGTNQSNISSNMLIIACWVKCSIGLSTFKICKKWQNDKKLCLMKVCFGTYFHLKLLFLYSTYILCWISLKEVFMQHCTTCDAIKYLHIFSKKTTSCTNRKHFFQPYSTFDHSSHILVLTLFFFIFSRGSKGNIRKERVRIFTINSHFSAQSGFSARAF